MTVIERASPEKTFRIRTMANWIMTATQLALNDPMFAGMGPDELLSMFALALVTYAEQLVDLENLQSLVESYYNMPAKLPEGPCEG